MRVATTTALGLVTTSRSRYTRSGSIGTNSNTNWTRELGPSKIEDPISNMSHLYEMPR